MTSQIALIILMCDRRPMVLFTGCVRKWRWFYFRWNVPRCQMPHQILFLLPNELSKVVCARIQRLRYVFKQYSFRNINISSSRGSIYHVVTRTLNLFVRFHISPLIFWWKIPIYLHFIRNYWISKALYSACGLESFFKSGNSIKITHFDRFFRV